MSNMAYNLSSLSTQKVLVKVFEQIPSGNSCKHLEVTLQWCGQEGWSHPPSRVLEGLIDMLWNDLAFEQKDVKRGNYAWNKHRSAQEMPISPMFLLYLSWNTKLSKYNLQRFLP